MRGLETCYISPLRPRVLTFFKGTQALTQVPSNRMVTYNEAKYCTDAA